MKKSEYKFREAQPSDIPRMKHIRDNVRENALVTLRIEVADYEQALFVDGKGWVAVDSNDEVVGFSCARLKQQDIWALFIDQRHEGRGVGNKLMELVEEWMFESGCDAIRLSTEPHTRAARLYRKRGWQETGAMPSGELGFKLPKPQP